jgi:extracellular factor (EF) 3-hydroxypalmitic acid methyl ester biosynthesis protein
MNTITNQRDQAISFLQNIIEKGGPETKEYDVLNEIFDHLSEDYKAGKMTEHELQLLQEGFGDECLENTLHGHIKTKPYGYAGDFMIIDKIYQEQITKDHRFEKWDIFWNNHSAAKAVRNRKDYFIKTMKDRLSSRGALQLLNVASGPARDLAELYEGIEPEQLTTVCVEADKTAINYAKNLNKANAPQINFIHQNIFRFSAEEKFDIVWSAGLFDYFDDNIFLKLLRKCISWTKPGGEVIIGNFSIQNPSRNYMELIGDWYLQHRSEEELINFALAAGAKRENIYVGKELEGVNLFLHVTVGE